MSDPWVLATQEWLNSTYTGVTGWDPVTEDGETGWETVYGLIKALQHELGITDLSDNFGSGTLAALEDVGDIGPDNDPDDEQLVAITKIVQGGLYCKGYDAGGGTIDGDYGPSTTSAVVGMRGDIGLGAGDGSVTPKLMKALLTMNAYVLVAGGDSTVRTIQRDLNSRYLDRQDFFVIPADGYYSRDVQNGLMFALQYEIGLADGVANGNFGPATQSGLASQANYGSGDDDDTNGNYFIHLFQAALIFNNYPLDYDGDFGPQTAATTTAFQAFCLLVQNGRSDFETWASLLVSTGDTSRQGRAADMITTITAPIAATLVSEGYETVGRYLTNTPVANPLDKNIKPGELATIFNADLTVFPIFQEGDDDISYFDYSSGQTAAQHAHVAAAGYDFLPGTVIYFAVDFDALQEEVESNVVPYFQGIRDELGSLGSPYRVGIYGARNTCSIISQLGLAELSFVSGMSTGYSGNLGFPLPTNWAFDQILEYEIGSGSGAVDIDKDIKSGRDLGQSSVTSTPPGGLTDLERTLIYIQRVYSLAIEYYNTVSDNLDTASLTVRYLRRYNTQGYQLEIGWIVLGGPEDPDFNDFVDGAIPSEDVPAAFTDTSPTTVGIDWPHMMATASAYMYNGPATDSTGPEFSDFGGWGGDLTSLLIDFGNYKSENPSASAQTYAHLAIQGSLVTSFSGEDLHADVNGFLIARYALDNPQLNFAEVVRAVLTGLAYPEENQYASFLRLRLQNATTAAVITKAGLAIPEEGEEETLYQDYQAALLTAHLSDLAFFTQAERDDLAQGIVDEVVLFAET